MAVRPIDAVQVLNDINLHHLVDCDEDFCFLICPLSKRPPEGEKET